MVRGRQTARQKDRPAAYDCLMGFGLRQRPYRKVYPVRFDDLPMVLSRLAQQIHVVA